MIKLRNPFYIVKKQGSFVTTACYHCGTVVELYYTEVRAYNYCNPCK